MEMVCLIYMASPVVLIQRGTKKEKNRLGIVTILCFALDTFTIFDAEPQAAVSANIIEYFLLIVIDFFLLLVLLLTLVLIQNEFHTVSPPRCNCG
jgi:hypothetical protein